MWLPTPSPKHVVEFAELAKREFDLDLSPDEALDAATRLLHIHFILTYLYHPKPSEGEERQTTSTITESTRMVRK